MSTVLPLLLEPPLLLLLLLLLLPQAATATRAPTARHARVALRTKLIVLLRSLLDTGMPSPPEGVQPNGGRGPRQIQLRPIRLGLTEPQPRPERTQRSAPPRLPIHERSVLHAVHPVAAQRRVARAGDAVGPEHAVAITRGE